MSRRRKRHSPEQIIRKLRDADAMPAALRVPKDSFRQITACRNGRSPALFVGLTPS